MPISSESPKKRPIRILLANPRGYCAGVERAIQMVEAALRLREEPIYVRHEIVHNRYVVEELEAKGAIFVDEVDQVPDGAIVIFSAHGVARRVVDQAEGRKLEYLDATCPLVNKVHFEAEHHHRAGRHILFIGHKGHPEVEGTLGQVPDGAVTVVGSVAEAEAVSVPDPDKVAYLTQTTLSVDDTAAIVATLTRRFPAIKGPNKADICYATTNRQVAVRALAKDSDLLLVIGAPNSSNSNRLVEVARSHGCSRAMLIERASDIAWDTLDDVETVGLTAGASAPEVLVQEVIENFRLRFDVTLETVTVSEENVSFSIPKALVG